MTAIVKLGDVFMGGVAGARYTWDLSYGTEPAVVTYPVSAKRALAVKLGVPLTLSVANVRKPLRVEHVYALEVGAGSRPEQRVLKLADRRWLWSKKRISSSFNVRRIQGQMSLFADSGQPQELVTVEEDIRWAKYSLDPPANGTKRWTARRVLEFIFEQLDQPVVFLDDPPLPETPIIDLVIEDNGAAAVERALQHLPGCDVYLGLDGVAYVLNTQAPYSQATRTRTRGAGQAVLPTLGRKHVQLGGDAIITERKAIRPSKVIVLFTPEVEMRFDSVPETSGSRTRDTPTLVNVAPSPDLTLTLNNGDTVARGSYVPLETLMATWGAFGVLSRTLSFSALAQHGTAASTLEQLMSRTGAGLHDPVSAARVRAAVTSWRRLWQIDERFVQRLASIKANRTAIINPQTGTRARAEAFCDFIRRPNRRNPGAAGNLRAGNYGWFQRGYAALLADAKVAPVLVSVVSEHAGIIRTEPELDAWGISDSIMLGYPLAAANVPKVGGHASSNLSGIQAEAQWRLMQLATDFQVATVLTVIPASPNTIDRLHRVEISPSDIGTDGDGPEVYLRVFPSIMTARFAWSDAAADEIRDSVLRGTPRPLNLLVNDLDVRNVAEATARAFYASLVDTPDTSSGAVSVDLNPKIVPTGAIGKVTHGLSGEGHTTSTAVATGFRRAVDIWKFLDGGTRQVILRDGLRGEE